MAVTKMVQQLSGGKGGNAASVLRSPMAVCMLIRMAAKVLDEDPKFVPYLFPPPPFLPFVGSLVRKQRNVELNHSLLRWLLKRPQADV